MKDSPIDTTKQSQIDQLKSQVEKKGKTHCEAGRKVVWGEGPLDAAVVIVGEAPGAREEELRKPFVGMAGLLLSDELRRAGLRREDMWLTNVVKCRPVKSSSGGEINRPVSAKEVQGWLSTLLDELKIIRPKIILCLGVVAANALIHKKFEITNERGKWFNGPFGTRAMATFHPSYIRRQMSDRWNETVENFRRDLREVAEMLERLEKEPKARM